MTLPTKSCAHAITLLWWEMKGQLDSYTVVTMETLLDLRKWLKAGWGLAVWYTQSSVCAVR